MICLTSNDDFVSRADEVFPHLRKTRVKVELKPLCEKVWRNCEAQGISGKTVTVKIKYSDFTQATRSRTSAMPIASIMEIFDTAAGLLTTVYPFNRPVRLLGVTLSSLTNDNSRDTAPEQKPQFDLGL